MSERPETDVLCPCYYFWAVCTNERWMTGVGNGPRLANWVGQEITVWQQNKIMKMKWRNDKISKTRRDIKRALVDLISYKPKILISKLLPNTSWYLSKPKSWKLVTALMIWNRVKDFCLELTCFSIQWFLDPWKAIKFRYNMPHMIRGIGVVICRVSYLMIQSGDDENEWLYVIIM